MTETTPVQVELALGDIVETTKGAKFWGKVIGLHDNDGERPGATVEAIHPEFVGTRHVYPVGQLRLRPTPQPEPRVEGVGVQTILGTMNVGTLAGRSTVQSRVLGAGGAHGIGTLVPSALASGSTVESGWRPTADEWGGRPTPTEVAEILRRYERKFNLPLGDNNFADAADVIDRLLSLLAAERTAREQAERGTEQVRTAMIAKHQVAWREAEMAKARARAAETRAERLEKALKPFADVLKDNYHHQNDEMLIVAGFGAADLRWHLKLGDFRRAKAALASHPTEEEQRV